MGAQPCACQLWTSVLWLVQDVVGELRTDGKPLLGQEAQEEPEAGIANSSMGGIGTA